MQTTTMVPPEAQEKVKEIEVYVKEYETYKIVNNDEYINSAALLKQVKAKTRELKGVQKNLTDPVDETKRKIKEFFAVPIGHLLSAEQKIKGAMLSWQQEQERIRREEERKLREEQEAKEAMLRKMAEEAKKEGKENFATDLEEKAKEMESTEIVVKPKVEKVQGIATRTLWTFEIIDEEKIPREYMKVDGVKIGQDVRGGVREIPGVRIYSKEIIAA